MSKKVLLSVWVSVMFVALGFILFSCGPKKQKPEPGKEVTEGETSIFEMPSKEEKSREVAQKETTPSAEGILLVADFNTDKKPNNVGGDFGAWNGDSADFEQGCFESFISTTKHGDEGYSLQLMYDVDSSKPAYNGFWMKLNGIDISGYKDISFWVKGDAERGFTRVFKVELKNKQREVGSYYVTDIGPEWKEIVIALDNFKGIKDFSSMDEFVIVFEDRIATRKEGAIYIDDVSFVK